MDSTIIQVSLFITFKKRRIFMAGEGEKLRTAREMKAWSFNDAEEATKIRARYLEALENEQYEIIPGIAYVKGFLQTYAKHLDLDPVEILTLYKSSSQVPEKKNPLRMPFNFSSHPLWRRPVTALITAILVICAIVAIAHWSSNNQTPVSYTPAPLPTAPVENEVKDTDSNAPVSSDAVSSENQPSTPSNSLEVPETQGLIAQLVFNQNCWLLVKADGKVALEGEYSGGTTKELKADNNIEFVTVGNAGGLSVTLNGTVQPSMGGSGQVVNNIVLTKDSISTR
jgi:cytoskeletal protein RodZ